MSIVNPPRDLKIPQIFLEDPEVRNYFERKDFILYQMWYRTGGGSDNINDQDEVEGCFPIGLEESAETLQNDVSPQSIDDERIDELEVESALNLGRDLGSEELVYVVAPDDNYNQLEDDDVVFMTGTNNFNLIPQATAHKNICIKNDGSGTITIVPDGSETSQTTSLTTTQSIRLAPRGASFSWSTI